MSRKASVFFILVLSFPIMRTFHNNLNWNDNINETLGEHTKRASSYLIMSIVGGAIAPIIMGYIADTISTATGFIVPLLCFIVILAYAIHLQKNNR